MVEVEGAKERAERAKKLLALKPADRIGLEREMTRQFPALVADVLALLAEREALQGENEVLREVAIDFALDEWYTTPTQAHIDQAIAR